MRRDFLVFKILQICLLENFIVNFITFQQLWTHLLFISNKVFCRRQIYLRLKNKKSRRVGESPPACVGLKAGFHSGKPESNIGSDRNQHRIGLFQSCIIYTAGPEKVENTSTLYHPGCGSNWNRKFVPKAHARVQFCSDPMLINFPAFMSIILCNPQRPSPR